MNEEINLSPEEIQRYSRHLLLPEVGVEGQKKLKGSRVLIVGTGGLGSPVAMYLAAAGVGRIGLVDYDVVEYSNLQRQVIHGSKDVGVLKVESAKQTLEDINPTIKIEVYNTVFNSKNALKIGGDYDLIVDATDNFPTRYLISDLCVKLGIVHVYASIYRFDGQLSLFDTASGGACYRCLFPEPPPPGSVPSCAEGGVLGVLPGTMGSLQASEAIKHLLGIGDTLSGRLLLYNALEVRFDFVNLRKNPDCAVCSLTPDKIELIDYEAFCGVPVVDENIEIGASEFEIGPEELKDQLGSRKNIVLVDVREAQELNISNLQNSLHIPLGQLAGRFSELDADEEIVVYCRSGVRSDQAVKFLREKGFQSVRNLVGGINDWARKVDPSLPIY